MKKSTEKVIKKAIGDNRLEFDVSTMRVLWNDVPITKAKAKLIDEITKLYEKKDISYDDIVEFAKMNVVNVKERKEAEKERKQQEKQAEKERLKEEKQASKDAKTLQKSERVKERIERNKLNFVLDENGNIDNVAINYEIYFTHHPKYDGRIQYNEWIRRNVIDGHTMSEVELRTCYADIENDILLSSRPKVDDAIYRVAKLHSYHPVKDYLCDVAKRWDGVERLKDLFVTKMKANDEKYVPLYQECTTVWFKGAVKRVFKPGCKNEIMIILVGCQGDGKNTLIEWLFDPFGIELNVNIDKEQEYGMKLDQCWCVLEDELAKWDKKEAGAYKKWLSIRKDNFRLPYEHYVETHERHNCYAGSSNNRYFLKDFSDKCERRYWPIFCHGTKDESWDMVDTLTNELRDQIWGEAAYKYFEDQDCPVDIRGKFVDMLEELQQNFKISNEDNVAEILKEILEREYWLNANGQFDDANDMLRQINGADIGQFGMKTRQKINKIPSSFVKIIMKNVIKDVRKHDYFKYTLQKEWEVNVQDSELNTKVYRRWTPQTSIFTTKEELL